MRQTPCLFWSELTTQCLEQWLPYIRCLINMYWANEQLHLWTVPFLLLMDLRSLINSCFSCCMCFSWLQGYDLLTLSSGINNTVVKVQALLIYGVRNQLGWSEQWLNGAIIIVTFWKWCGCVRFVKIHSVYTLSTVLYLYVLFFIKKFAFFFYKDRLRS